MVALKTPQHGGIQLHHTPLNCPLDVKTPLNRWIHIPPLLVGVLYDMTGLVVNLSVVAPKSTLRLLSGIDPSFPSCDGLGNLPLHEKFHFCSSFWFLLSEIFSRIWIFPIWKGGKYNFSIENWSKLFIFVGFPLESLTFCFNFSVESQLPKW